MSADSAQSIYLLHALTPLHVGTESGIGAIDVPTTRERHTQFPIIPGSSVKGVLREAAEVKLEREYETRDGRSHRLLSPKVAAAFGPRKDKASEHRGGLVFGDAQLLALPVRSQKGTWAWVSCPLVLSRLARDLEGGALRLKSALTWPKPARQDDTARILVGKDSALTLNLANQGNKVLLEDLVLSAEVKGEVELIASDLAGWIWPDPGDAAARDFFALRFAVVHDDLFSHLARTALEVRWRVSIDDDTGTAARSGPWTEEHIPAEALLVGVVRGRSATRQGDQQQAAEHLQTLRDLVSSAGVLRFGGKSSVGLGRAHMRLPGSVGRKP